MLNSKQFTEALNIVSDLLVVDYKIVIKSSVKFKEVGESESEWEEGLNKPIQVSNSIIKKSLNARQTLMVSVGILDIKVIETTDDEVISYVTVSGTINVPSYDDESEDFADKAINILINIFEINRSNISTEVITIEEINVRR
jgi:hypothetical protein